MKTYCNLPDYIQLSDGAVLKAVIGGHLEQKPFLAEVTAANEDNIIDAAKARGLKWRKIGVLSKNLRGKRDLHGSPYRPTIWIFVQVNEPARIFKEYAPRK